MMHPIMISPPFCGFISARTPQAFGPSILVEVTLALNAGHDASLEVTRLAARLGEGYVEKYSAFMAAQLPKVLACSAHLVIQSTRCCKEGLDLGLRLYANEGCV